MSIDSFIPLLKQHTPGVRNVLSSREHTPADAFSTRWQQCQQHCCRPLQTSTSRRLSSSTLWICTRTHAAAWSPKSCNQWGSGPDCWGHSSGEMKSAVSRCRSSTVSRTRCAGALSCWKTKLSPATCLIAGNICCDEEHPWNICRRLLPRVRRRKAQQRPFLTLRLTPDTEAVFCFFYFIVYNHFLISQGSAETLFRRGGKIKHLSIA